VRLGHMPWALAKRRREKSLYFLLFSGDGFCIWTIKMLCEITWSSEEILVTRLPAERSGVQIPAMAKIFHFSKRLRPNFRTTQSRVQEVPGFFGLWQNVREESLTTYSHLVSELRISGGIPPLHLYVFVERIRTSWRSNLKIWRRFLRTFLS
jgi:hypothetical protein